MKKRYYNSTTKEWYTEGNSLTRRVNGTLFSGVPSVEQLTAWGFVEWVEPAPTPEQLLERAKQEKIAEIEAYDQSDAVNGFDVTIGGNTMSLWIDRETMVSPKVTVNCTGNGNMSVTDWKGHTFDITDNKNVFVRDYACSSIPRGSMTGITINAYRPGVVHQINGVLGF